MRKTGTTGRPEPDGRAVGAASTGTAPGKRRSRSQRDGQVARIECPAPAFDSVFDELAYRMERAASHSYVGATPSMKAVADDAQLVLAVREREGLIDDARRTRQAWHWVRTTAQWLGLLSLAGVAAVTICALHKLNSEQFVVLIHDCLSWHLAAAAALIPGAGGGYWLGRRRAGPTIEADGASESEAERR